MPHFTYCSSVWNSCLKEDSDRLERLHEIALRYVLMTFPTDMIDYVIRLVTH